MIVVRAPLRISFVGGGTDLTDLYQRYQGRVISTAIDKYVYVVINRTPLIPYISARYKISETVDLPQKLQHTRIKAALLDLGIKKGIEIASFASLPAKTGLGSSSSFSVALLKGLSAFLGKKLDSAEAAELACRLELTLLGEPIGKQDQYAAAFGGLNIIDFQSDNSVVVKPLLLDYRKKLEFENHLLVFFTGLTRDASSVLKEQKVNIQKKIKVLKKMANSVEEFTKYLFAGKIIMLGKLLHESLLYKKNLSSTISNSVINELYMGGIKAGAWGGKILGAGGGGCLLFITPVEKKQSIRKALKKKAQSLKLLEFREIPIRFVQSGAEILFNADLKNNGKLY